MESAREREFRLRAKSLLKWDAHPKERDRERIRTNTELKDVELHRKCIEQYYATNKMLHLRYFTLEIAEFTQCSNFII